MKITAGNLHDFAETELKRAGMFDPDADYGGMLAKNIMDVVDTFRSYGHSGGSASIVLEILPKLLNYETLTPCPHDDVEDWSHTSGSVDETLMCEHCGQIWFDGEPVNMEELKGSVFMVQCAAQLKKRGAHELVASLVGILGA